MTTLTIRNARQDEAALLTDIAKRSKAYWGYDEKFMAKCQEELTVKSKNIGKDDSAHVVAEKENKVIGFYALQNIDGKEFELGALYVAAEHIKTGVGYELMAHAKNRRRSGRTDHHHSKRPQRHRLLYGERGNPCRDAQIIENRSGLATTQNNINNTKQRVIID